MGISDRELDRNLSFPAGLNNVTDPGSFPRNEDGQLLAFAKGQNVDVTDAASVVRARGHEILIQGVAHSLHPRRTELLACVDGELRAYGRSGNSLTLMATLATGLQGFVTHATDDFETTYWSNEARSGRVLQDLSVRDGLWIDTPQPVSLAAITGGMPPGAYEVSVTVIDSAGAESGASAPVVLHLTTAGAIAITLPPAPAGTAGWRVYATTTDGADMALAAELPSAATSAAIHEIPRGPALETAWMRPLPPCSKLVYAMNRLFGITGRNALVWSEPYRLGLMGPNNVLLLGAEATLLECVGEGSEAQGLFVADHKRTYWLAGANPANWQQVARRPAAAVPGTATLVPGTAFGLETETNVAFWIERSGTACLGLAGGNVIPVRDGEVAMPVDAERGAAGFFAHQGVRHILTSLLGGGLNPLAQASDSAEITVRRNGVLIT
jgi:hypothetical protein